MTFFSFEMVFYSCVCFGKLLNFNSQVTKRVENFTETLSAFMLVNNEQIIFAVYSQFEFISS